MPAVRRGVTASVPPMTQAGSVTLQINVAPVDLPHAAAILPHQLRQWGGQVQEILFTFDLHRTARGGHFGEGWEERREPMRELLEGLCREHPYARIAEIDYAPRAYGRDRRRVHRRRADPRKGHEGRALLPVLLRAARGTQRARVPPRLRPDVRGSSQTWIEEAARCWPSIPMCSPATRSRGRPPPTGASPRARAALRAQLARVSLHDAQHPPVPDRPPAAAGAPSPLPLLGPARAISSAKARLHGNPPYRAAEL